MKRDANWAPIPLSLNASNARPSSTARSGFASSMGGGPGPMRHLG